MNFIKDFEDSIDVTAMMEHMTNGDPSLYEDDLEELLELARKQDALHPALMWCAATVTDVTEKGPVIEGTLVELHLPAKTFSVGEQIFPCLITAGPDLDRFGKELDDPLLAYLNNELMNICLEDGLIRIACEVGELVPGRALSMVMPGIAGVCELSQIEQVLQLLPDGPEKTGVSLGEDKLLRPLYSQCILLYADQGGVSVPEEDASPAEQASFIRRINETAGHM